MKKRGQNVRAYITTQNYNKLTKQLNLRVDKILNYLTLINIHSYTGYKLNEDKNIQQIFTNGKQSGFCLIF